MFKIKLDKDKCIGCGTCAAVCPANFEMKGDKADLIKQEVEILGCNRVAEENCPVKVISIKSVSVKEEKTEVEEPKHETEKQEG